MGKPDEAARLPEPAFRVGRGVSQDVRDTKSGGSERCEERSQRSQLGDSGAIGNSLSRGDIRVKTQTTGKVGHVEAGADVEAGGPEEQRPRMRSGLRVRREQGGRAVG